MAHVTIRPLVAGDLEFAMRLKDAAGWNQTEDDWRRLLELDPEGCFLAQVDGAPAGTATGITWGATGWVGMMLVDSERRRHGLGTLLLDRVVRHLRDERRCATVRLDATPVGKQLYDRHGFVDEYRLERRLRPPARIHGPALPPADEILPLDREAFREDRAALLGTLLRRPQFSAQTRDGYLLARPGTRAAFIGPWVARDAATAEALLRAALAAIGDRAVVVDVPRPNGAALEIAARHGFAAQRELIRMALGPPGREDLGRIFGSAGPELG